MIDLGYTDCFIIKGQWSINDQDYLYWSNENGWVDKHSSTVFNSWELNVTSLPLESTGIALIDGGDEFMIARQIPISEINP